MELCTSWFEELYRLEEKVERRKMLEWVHRGGEGSHWTVGSTRKRIYCHYEDNIILTVTEIIIIISNMFIIELMFNWVSHRQLKIEVLR